MCEHNTHGVTHIYNGSAVLLFRYRAKVEKMEGSKCHVLYLDFGNVSSAVSVVVVVSYAVGVVVFVSVVAPCFPVARCCTHHRHSQDSSWLHRVSYSQPSPGRQALCC